AIGLWLGRRPPKRTRLAQNISERLRMAKACIDRGNPAKAGPGHHNLTGSFRHIVVLSDPRYELVVQEIGKGRIWRQLARSQFQIRVVDEHRNNGPDLFLREQVVQNNRSRNQREVGDFVEQDEQGVRGPITPISWWRVDRKIVVISEKCTLDPVLF